MVSVELDFGITVSLGKSVGKTEKEGEKYFPTSIHLSQVTMIPFLKLPHWLLVFPSSNCSRAALSFPLLVEEACGSFPLQFFFSKVIRIFEGVLAASCATPN